MLSRAFETSHVDSNGDTIFTSAGTCLATLSNRKAALHAAGLDPGETPHHVLPGILVQEVLVYFTFLELLHHCDHRRLGTVLVGTVPRALLLFE
jgi:hypothetical protein